MGRIIRMVEYSLDLQNINLSAIRTVRVLRPLKAINRVPSMRILVKPPLGYPPHAGKQENFTLSTGVSLPTPYYQLEEMTSGPSSAPWRRTTASCRAGTSPHGGRGGRECCLDKDDALQRQELGLSPEPLVNGSASAAGLCVNWNQYYTRCYTGHSNPHKGAINFDNIGFAWIVIFQVITLEGWVEIMYYVMDAHSFYNFIYFIFLIIIGSFFMINLCLVVIATQFSETKQREHQLMQEQRAQCLSSSTLASMAEPGDCYEEIFQYVCHVLRKARRRSAALYNTLRGRPAPAGGGRGRAGRAGAGANTSTNGGDRHRRRPRRPHCPYHHGPDHTPHSPGTTVALSVTPNPEDCPHCTGALSLRESPAKQDEEGGALEEMDWESNHMEERSGEEAESEAGKKKPSCIGRGTAAWNEMRRKLRSIVESKYFNRGIMIAILINTISMGIEHHDQPEELTNVLEISNIVFTSMFTLEMILKLTAFGFFSYLRNPYNIFDGIIVIISVCEIIGQADGGLSVLRTFRLLRVIKLVRFMPALRRQLVVLMKTMDNVATFCMLLMLFIFIFSILGMHIFGCKFSLKTEAGDTVPDRKNFDSLLWAIVTVFQILTQEDWNVVLYNGMASTSPLAALYFVALMTFGNYVLFNLLVAILVEGFQAEGDANRSYSDDDRSSINYEEGEKQKDPLQLSDPKICTLTPNGHLDLPPAPSTKGPYPGERLALALGPRKSSVISLGANVEQRALCPGRSSLYHSWGRPPIQTAWSRRSSWNSLSRTPRRLGAGAGVGGGSLRVHSVHSNPGEHESLLSPPPLPLPPPPLLPRHFAPRRDRRALSLELPELLQVPGPPLHPLPRKKSFSGGLGGPGGAGEHQDCNGKTHTPQPSLLGEVFPQLNSRKEREELEEEVDYSLCFRIQKMMEVYRPEWCEAREDWSVYLFSPQNRFRLLCQSIIAHKLFDYVVLAFIFSNCITVALERPKIHQGSLERVFLTISNYVFTAIFVGEMTLKARLRRDQR
ncbi:hypothetical protein SKAU_G00299810 [Synaphobranchus kaupii]|uniref:Ion transport domain-containing protein n=1 Tax=Synaphobranchus kaupii TaxID=118154 RepID=A0A9Q1EVI2_SYNKA|nr:hypothetical protein SKAU_G00299810 [Synaphobranchus kaupii]